MKKIITLFMSMLCAVVSWAQSTDAMLFGDVKAKERVSRKTQLHPLPLMHIIS